VTDVEPYPLTLDDLDWVTGLAAARRARLAPFAPRFWNPSPDARAVHAEFLGRLIGSPDVMAVRSEHGFLFGLPRRGQLLVDDMVIDDMVLTDDAYWPDEGTTLLQFAARAADLSVGESWWHRDLDRQPSAPAAELGEECRLVPAPPVYDPGGPVLLVSAVADAGALTRAEQAAAARGATVSVVSQDPADDALAALLTKASYRRTTDYFTTPA